MERRPCQWGKIRTQREKTKSWKYYPAYLVENGGGGVAPHIGDAVRNQHQVLAAVVNGGVGGQHSGARPYAGIDVGAALQLVFKDGFNLGIAIGVQAGQRQDEALVVSGFC